MSKRNAAQEKAARLAAQRHAPVVDPEAPEPVPEQSRPIVPDDRKKVRLTLDLAPALYDDFGDWTRQASRRMNRRVTSTDVLRALVRRLLADEELAAAVLRDVRGDGR